MRLFEYEFVKAKQFCEDKMIEMGEKFDNYKQLGDLLVEENKQMNNENLILMKALGLEKVVEKIEEDPLEVIEKEIEAKEQAPPVALKENSKEGVLSLSEAKK